MDDRQFVNIREASRRLGVSENTIRNWTNNGSIGSVRLAVSGFRRIPRSEVERIESLQRIEAAKREDAMKGKKPEQLAVVRTPTLMSAVLELGDDLRLSSPRLLEDAARKAGWVSPEVAEALSGEVNDMRSKLVDAKDRIGQARAFAYDLTPTQRDALRDILGD